MRMGIRLRELSAAISPALGLKSVMVLGLVYRPFPALPIWAWWAFSVDCGVSSGNCSGLLDVLVTVELSEGSLFRVLGWLVVVGSQL